VSFLDPTRAYFETGKLTNEDKNKLNLNPSFVLYFNYEGN